MPSTYVITGASRGLGAEFVRQLSKKGDIVIACARNTAASEDLAALVDNKTVYAVDLDTVNPESIKAAVARIEQLAPQGIDTLINNAGIAGSRDADATNTTAEEYKKVFDTNVIGTSDVTQAFLPLLRKASTRRIVNITSVLGSITLANAMFGPSYRIAKAAENMLGKLFAETLAGEGFTVLNVHPGYVQTRMGGKDAHITPEVSIRGMLSVIEGSTKESNGTFVDYEGKSLPW
ncbi:4-dihydrotrisporin dehydrogenase [Phascolomyces articulosus]|uniref:4-dihydrotrisporin dehydrogenase n=1 Tax=Phascolomyces articulosus TaxID=60185 RepID=A0AAD5KID6_9FUNG|nr:4-dihydrotrisporin dehydrogenase [Phascolomyces articulosus]